MAKNNKDNTQTLENISSSKPEKDPALQPKPSNKSSTQKNRTPSTNKNKKSTSSYDDYYLKALEIDNKRYAEYRAQDKKIDDSKREMRLLNQPEVKDILKKDRSLRDSFIKNLKTMSDSQAINQLKTDYNTKSKQQKAELEDNEIRSCGNSQNPIESFAKRGKKLVGSNSQLADVAVHDMAFANKHGIASSGYMSVIGSVRSDYTQWLVTSNHIATEHIKKLPEDQQASALNKYYTLQKQSPNDAMEYIRLISGHIVQNPDVFWDNNLSLMSQVPESDPDDFMLWQAKQDILSAMGDEKDEKYYTNRINTGTFYNDYTKAEDFEEHVKKGREMPWGPAMVYLSSYTADQLGDRKHTIYDYMTEKEKDIYAYTLSKYGETPGDDYLAFLADDLEARRSDAELMKAQDFAEDHPVISSVYTGPASAVSGIQSFYNLGRQELLESLYPSEYVPDRVLNNKNSIKNKNDMIVDTVADGIDNEALRYLYEGGMDTYQDIVQNTIYGSLSPALGAINEAGNNADDMLNDNIPKDTIIQQIMLSESIDLGKDTVLDYFGINDNYTTILDFLTEDIQNTTANKILGIEQKESIHKTGSNYISPIKMTDEEFETYINSILNP